MRHRERAVFLHTTTRQHAIYVWFSLPPFSSMAVALFLEEARQKALNTLHEYTESSKQQTEQQRSRRAGAYHVQQHVSLPQSSSKIKATFFLIFFSLSKTKFHPYYSSQEKKKNKKREREKINKINNNKSYTFLSKPYSLSSTQQLNGVPLSAWEGNKVCLSAKPHCSFLPLPGQSLLLGSYS